MTFADLIDKHFDQIGQVYIITLFAIIWFCFGWRISR